MDSRHATSATCANCGSEQVAAYCAQCGQNQTVKQRSLWNWLREFFADQFSLSARLPRTLWLLFRTPGFLSLEWSAGRRARYLDPIRLYLLALLVALAVITFWGVKTAAMSMAPSANGSLGRVTLDVAVREATRTAMLFSTVVMVPVIALTLKLVLLPRRTWLVDHVVFATHFFAFALFVLAISWPISQINAGVGLGLGLSSVFIHLIYALQRTYGLSGADGAVRILGVLIAAIGCALFLGARGGEMVGARLSEVDQRMITELDQGRVTSFTDQMYWGAIAQENAIRERGLQLDSRDPARDLVGRTINHYYKIEHKRLTLEHGYRIANLFYLNEEYKGAIRVADAWTYRASQEPLKLATLAVAFNAALAMGDAARAEKYANAMTSFQPHAGAPALDPRHQPQLDRSLAEARRFLSSSSSEKR